MCHAWTGDSHASGPDGRGHIDGRVVGRRDRSRQADRHRSLVRRLRQRARRLPGLHRAGVAASRSTASRTARASRSSRSATWCAPRPASPTTSASTCGTASSVDRWAGCRCSSGASPIPGGCARSCPIATCAQATAQQIAWGCDRSPRDPARPEVARRRLLRRRARRRSVAGPGGRPDGRPGHVPQRQRVHRPLRARARRRPDDEARLRSRAALRGRALPRAPRRQADPPLRHQQLPC